MRVVIELRRGISAEVIINNLYSQTQLQTVFGINMVALVDGQPKVLPLRTILDCFIKHRRQVVSRRTLYELRKARERAHLLEGLGVALANIDPVIALIKSAKNPLEAKTKLLAQTWPAGVVSDMLAKAGSEICRPQGLDPKLGLHNDEYLLSAEQAQAILDLKLHRLTGLEQDKIISEFKVIITKIADLLEILNVKERLMRVVREELQEINEEFCDERRTEIISNQQDLTVEDLITEEDMVVTLSHHGYVKSQPLTTYEAQRRGGKGKAAASVKDEDYIEQLLIASTHDTILCFSDGGKVYWLKTYQLPVASRTAKGRPIVNLLPLAENEKISTILPIRKFTAEKSVFMATANGTVKRVELTQFTRPRNSGLIAVDLEENDKLIGVSITEANSEVMLISNVGKSIRFAVKNVRVMGRTAKGVRGIKLQPGQSVIGLIVIEPGGYILTATKNGYGKRTKVDEFSTIGRGGQGVIAIQTSERNGAVVGVVQVKDGDELMLISDQGTLVRTRVAEISVVGRNTQGVKLINLAKDEHLVAIQSIEEIIEEIIEESSADDSE